MVVIITKLMLYKLKINICKTHLEYCTFLAKQRWGQQRNFSVYSMYM